MFFNPSTLAAILGLVSAVPALANPTRESSLPSVRRSLASKLDRRSEKLKRQADAQTSLTLLASQVAPGLAKTGQEGGGDPGQVASLTSTNNYINFCLTQNGVPLTNGQQIKTGSCNAVPMGRIIASTKMPACKFQNPKNGDTIAANVAFTINMVIANMVTGNFVNPASNYYSAPQQVDGSGTVIGHSHVTIEKLTAPDQITATDPQQFVFFKGLNDAAKGGILSAAVTAGLPAGSYRMCSINSAANHQPVLVAVAQRGSTDDCVYFQATAGGGNAGGNNGNAGGNGGNGAATTAAATSVAATSAAATSTAAAGNGGNNTGGRGGNGNGGGRGGNNNGGRGGNNAAAVTSAPVAASSAPVATSSSAAPVASTAPATGANLQAFTGKLGGAAPVVTTGDRGFVTNGNSFLSKANALQRSCDIQSNTCSNAANSSGNKAPLTVQACQTQAQACAKLASA